MLALESTKKYKANIIRQFAKGRCVFQTHVVCVTDKNAASLAECVCSYSDETFDNVGGRKGSRERGSHSRSC